MIPRRLLVLGLTVTTACGPSDVDAPSGPESSGTLISELVIYGHKFGMALTLDVYTPEEPNGAGVVFMNSASWVSPAPGCVFVVQEAEGPRLDPDSCRGLNPVPLMDAGFTVFNVRHGSSPRFDVGEATHDAHRAVRYIQDNAPSFGVDPARLGVWGASAGGHLASMVGFAPDFSESEDSGPLMPIRAVAVYMTPFSVEEVPPEMLELVPALDMPSDALREVSPIRHVSGDDPPTLIVHGDADTVVPIEVGHIMYSALADAGVEAEFLVLEGARHGFTGQDADSAGAASLAWFRRHLVR